MRRSAVSAASVLAALIASVAGCADSPKVSSGSPKATAAAARVASFECPAAVRSAGTPSGGPSAGTKLQVVTTVAPITSIVANIAGDRATVRGIVPEGEDSHTFEPKPSAAAVLSEADLVFVNGLKLEDPTTELATTNVPAGTEIVELGSQTISPDQYLYDFSFPIDGGKPNPHLWTNPPMARCYASIAAARMAEADPANADYYTANAEEFGSRIDQLDSLMKDATAAMPARDRQLLTYHDAYAYFAAHYGWKVIGAIQVSSFEDPTPKDVAKLIDQIRARKVPAIFGSEVFPSPVLEQLADEAGVRYVDELRDDDLPGAPGDADHSYLGLMKYDFATMVDALGGDASGLRAFDDRDVVTDRADYPQ